jgi:hypothetical protein
MELFRNSGTPVRVYGKLTCSFFILFLQNRFITAAIETLLNWK